MLISPDSSSDYKDFFEANLQLSKQKPRFMAQGLRVAKGYLILWGNYCLFCFLKSKWMTPHTSGTHNSDTVKVLILRFLDTCQILQLSLGFLAV